MISYSTPSNMPAVAHVVPSAWMLPELRGIAGVIANPAPLEGLTHAETLALVEAERQEQTNNAYDAGYLAGQLASATAAETHMRGMIEALRAAASQVVAMEATALGDLQDNLAALSVSIARQIIGREVSAAPELVVELVRLALTEFPIDQTLRVRINPADLAALTAAAGDAAIRISPDREITWLADPRVLSGGCLVEGRVRIIDGRVDLALERTYRTLAQLAV
ncbi:MAG: FliH/SctL family protein [bacterium]